MAHSAPPSVTSPVAPKPVFDAVADAATLEAAWRELERTGVVLPFQTHDWVSAWIAAGAQPPGSRILVIRCRRGDTTEMLLPLSVERIGPLRVARRLSGSHACYLLGARRDLGSIPADEIRAGFLAIGRAEGIDVFALDGVPTVWGGRPDPLVAAFAARPSLDDGHAVRLAPTFEALLAGRNAAHKRKKTRAKERLLEVAGGYRIAPASTPEEVETTLAAFFAQKSAALRARGIADPFAAPAVRDFYRRLAVASLGAAEPLLELTRLEAGGAVRAVIGASIRGGRLFALFTSYADDELARASPGETLFFRHIEAACRRGLGGDGGGIGGERYKDSWCDERVPLRDLHLADTLGGRIHVALTGLIGRAKAWVRRDEHLWPLVRRLRRRLAGRPAAGEERGGEG